MDKAMDEAERTRFTEALKQIQADGEVTVEEVQELIDQFPSLSKLMDESGDTADRLAQYLTETANSSEEGAAGLLALADGAGEAEESMETLAAKLSEALSKLDALKAAQEEMASTGAVSNNTLIKLLGQHGEALDGVILKYMAGIASQQELTDALAVAYLASLSGKQVGDTAIIEWMYGLSNARVVS